MANSIQSIGAIAQVAREGAVAAARAAQTTALKTRPSAPGASDPGRPSAQARVLAKSFSAEPAPPTGIFDFRGGLPAGSPTAAEGGVNAAADAAADPTGAGGGTAEGPPEGEGLQFTDEHLYGATGQPQPWHIDQDSLGDCYFVATLAALAAQQPELIQDAISYDPDTGVFTVTLHEREGRGPFGLFGSSTREVQIEVTQDDIQDNIDRNGGSRLDNGDEDAPIWPAVMEAASAKRRDGDWSNGLDAGYDDLEGGKARDAMFELTGSRGEDIPRFVAAHLGSEATLEIVDQALADGRPVTLSTDPESTANWLEGLFGGEDAPQDGLVDNHVYEVVRVYESDGEVRVVLRNPWAHNNVGEGQDTNSAFITVTLDDIVAGGGFEYFNIGPAPSGGAEHGSGSW